MRVLIRLTAPLTVLSARLIGQDTQQIVFRPISHQILYEYAILVPKLRRLSVLARQLASEWEAFLFSKLVDLDAQPSSMVLD